MQCSSLSNANSPGCLLKCEKYIKNSKLPKQERSIPASLKAPFMLLFCSGCCFNALSSKFASFRSHSSHVSLVNGSILLPPLIHAPFKAKPQWRLAPWVCRESGCLSGTACCMAPHNNKKKAVASSRDSGDQSEPPGAFIQVRMLIHPLSMRQGRDAAAAGPLPHPPHMNAL